MTTLKVLKFHTGRGGRFNNSGFVTFVDFENIRDGKTMEDLFEQENGVVLMSSGNECDCELNEDGTGYVNEDHDYDTTNCVFENELNEKQINALVKSDHWNDTEVSRVLNEYYSEYLDS